MPRTKQTTTGKEPANKQKGEKVCNFCHEKKKLTSFYISKNPIHSVDGRVPICKECIAKASLNEDGTINELELNKILKLISRPYYKDLIESSIQSFKREHSYIEDDKVQYYGKEILQKYIFDYLFDKIQLSDLYLVHLFLDYMFLLIYLYLFYLVFV